MAMAKVCDAFGTTKEVTTVRVGVQSEGGDMILDQTVDLSERGLERLKRLIAQACTPPKRYERKPK